MIQGSAGERADRLWHFYAPLRTGTAASSAAYSHAKSVCCGVPDPNSHCGHTLALIKTRSCASLYIRARNSRTSDAQPLDQTAAGRGSLKRNLDSEPCASVRKVFVCFVGANSKWYQRDAGWSQDSSWGHSPNAANHRR